MSAGRIDNRFNNLGMRIPKVLVPKSGIDLEKWAVVACDQHTSEPQYWQQLESYIGEEPSTLNLVLPECYLAGQDQGGHGDVSRSVQERITRIHAKMHEYVDTGVLQPTEPALRLVRRDLPGKHPRTGLLIALDLERYDFREGSRSLIRPTEGTILERIPSRTAIRRDAPLELPHVLVLIDDPERSIIEPLVEETRGSSPAFQTKLNGRGGTLAGYEITETRLLKAIVEGFERLFDKAKADADGMLFAVGDGNHSLAAAKTVWDEQKRSGTRNSLDQSCRFALVEVVNIHDAGVTFEPIHRIVGGSSADAFLADTALGQTADSVPVASAAEAAPDPQGRSGVIEFGVSGGTRHHKVSLTGTSHILAVGAVQEALDELAKNHPETSVDYIHGLDTLERLSARPNAFGISLPPIPKEQFFPILAQIGVFPRKSFSMGEANEKRYYFEARDIRCT